MSERLKRRKKPKESKPTEPPPTPLQPAYFDAEPPAAEPVAHAEPEPAPPEGPQAAPEPEAPDPWNRADQPPAADQRRRRRRGRGGRGRGGQRSAPVTVAAPVVTPAIDTAEPVPPAPTLPAEAQAVSTPTPVAPPRPPKGAVILAIGLPGSGKSSWFKRNGITPLSSDMLRMLLFDDAQEQRFQDLVFSNLRSMLKARLIARRPLNYVDATNLTPHERHSWIKLAKDYGYEVQAVYFDVPVEVCLERNRRRERSVDEDVMRRMAAKLKPPTFEEGFSKVTVVRVKKKDNEVAAE